MEIEFTFTVRGEKFAEVNAENLMFVVQEFCEGSAYKLSGSFRPTPPTAWGVVKQAWADLKLALRLWWATRSEAAA